LAGSRSDKMLTSCGFDERVTLLTITFVCFVFVGFYHSAKTAWATLRFRCERFRQPSDYAPERRRCRDKNPTRRWRLRVRRK
jgi:hypothetical protein